MVTLTKCQEAAYAAMVQLITGKEKVLIISGGAGVGKTTLVNTFLSEWEDTVTLAAGALPDLPIHLTATTNKAADALSESTGRPVVTIQSLLGFTVKNLGFNKTELEDTGKPEPEPSIIIVDEASFIDSFLLDGILMKTPGSKVIFMGDPWQLAPIGESTAPVFSQGYKEVEMTTVVRQADSSPIKTLSVNLRQMVAIDGPFPKAGVDGVNILHLQQSDFEREILNTFQCGHNNRVLAWTNKAANYYNDLVANGLKGFSDFSVGDHVTLNKMVQKREHYRYPTDSVIKIRAISDWYEDYQGITVRTITTQAFHDLVQPQNMTDVHARVKELYQSGQRGDIHIAGTLEKRYADLRFMYGSTVNKSQGSTYDTVFIDLNDIGKCRDKGQVKRMVYVAASRARNRVVFTGDVSL